MESDSATSSGKPFDYNGDAKASAAQAVERWGFRVFPTDGKEPIIDPATGYKLAWGGLASTNVDDFNHVWDGATGYGIVLDGMTVVDVDDLDVMSQVPHINETLVIKSPNGLHFYLKGESKPRPAIIKKVDIRSGRAYMVGPGSWNGGGLYSIAYDTPIDNLANQSALLKWIGTEPSSQNGTTPPSDDIFGPVNEGTRNDTLFRKVACLWRSMGMSYNEILAALLLRNQEVCNPPLPVRDIETIARSACKYARGDRIPKDAPPEPEQAFGDIRDVDYWNTDLTKEPPATFVQVGSFLISTDPTSPSFLIGRRKSGKSHIALNIAMDWPGRVLYICTESFPEMWRRVNKFYPNLIEKHKDGKFFLAEGWPPVIAPEEEGTLLIVDCLNPAVTQMGFDENDSQWVSKLIDVTKTFDCATVYVHHAGKDEGRGARGSSVSEDRVGTGYTVRKRDTNDHMVKMYLNRYGEEQPNTYWHFVSDALVQKDTMTVAKEMHQERQDKKDGRFRDCIKWFNDISDQETVTTKYCMNAWGLTYKAARTRIAALCDEKLLEKVAAGKNTHYKVAPMG